MGVSAISIADDLDALRSDVEGCLLVAFIDVSARMVLRVSADPKPRQEEIDALSDLASLCLESTGLPAFFDGDPPYSASIEGENETKHFVRSLVDPADALIIVASGAPENAQLWSRSQDLLAKHSSGEAPS